MINSPVAPEIGRGMTMPADSITQELHQQLKLNLEHERDRLRELLLELSEAERALGESQGEESDAGGGTADVASDATEQALELTLERTEREHLAEVEAALHRLEVGSYGTCEGCGRPIDVERLQALPWTRYCVRCARKV